MPDSQLKTLIVDDEPLAIERMQVICAGLAGIANCITSRSGKRTASISR